MFRDEPKFAFGIRIRIDFNLDQGLKVNENTGENSFFFQEIQQVDGAKSKCFQRDH